MLPPIIDPHQRLAELVATDRCGYAALSRMIGRPSGFLRRFAVDRVPSRLRDGERRLLAAYFGVSERELGGASDGRPPRRAGLHPVRRARRLDWYETRD